MMTSLYKNTCSVGKTPLTLPHPQQQKYQTLTQTLATPITCKVRSATASGTHCFCLCVCVCVCVWGGGGLSVWCFGWAVLVGLCSMCIKYHTYVDMNHVSAQGVDKHVINVHYYYYYYYYYHHYFMGV